MGLGSRREKGEKQEGKSGSQERRGWRPEEIRGWEPTGWGQKPGE